MRHSSISFKRLTGFDPVSAERGSEISGCDERDRAKRDQFAVIQARSSRAKTKPGKDAGRAHSSAEHPRTREGGREISRCDERARPGAEEMRPASPTEDAARRRFAAVRAESGSTDRTQAASRGKTANQTPVLSTPCAKKHKRRGHRAARAHHNRRAGR